MKPFTVSAVSLLLGLSVQRVRQLIKSGELPAFRPGGSRWRIDPAALQTFMDSRRNSSAPMAAPASSVSDSAVKS